MAVGVAIALPAPADGAASPNERCFAAAAGKRKTSLGVHQWTVRQKSHWCAERRRGSWRITSVERRTRIRTGTNWRLVSRGGGIERDGSQSATGHSHFHFRLRYPYFEQNCYPRLKVTMWPSGDWTRSVRTGC